MKISPKNKLLALTLSVPLIALIFIGSLFILNDETRETIATDQPEYIRVEINNTMFYAEIADSKSERATGLMYRTQLNPNSGMLFIFEDSRPRSFWMKNTYIPLDILFIDENLNIVKIHKMTEPEREYPTYDSIYPAKYVLELKGESTERFNIKEGDKIELF